MRYLKYLAFSSIVVACMSAVLASSCTQKAFEDSAKKCTNRFFAELKQNPKQDCRTLYSKLTACVRTVVKECRSNTDGNNLAVMRQRSKRIIATRSYYCEDGMLNSFESYKLPACRERGIEKMRKCSLSYHSTFRENRGSPDLCRKYSKAKRCIARSVEKFCKKTDDVKRMLSMFKDPYNPYCPGSQDPTRSQKRARNTWRPFGACSEREYLIATRVCLSSFVHTLQKEPNKTCRWAYVNKLDNCAKNIALHCFKNESRYAKKNMERSFTRNRAYQERRYCDGFNFQLSYPRMQHSKCERNYVAVKRTCEASYVATYKENKADGTLCRKYAEAKSCAKNATLSLCKKTPHLVDQVNFIYDRFNPFCFNLSDPPLAQTSRKSSERVPRESGQWVTMEDSGRPTEVASVSKASTNKLLSVVVVASLLVSRLLI